MFIDSCWWYQKLLDQALASYIFERVSFGDSHKQKCLSTLLGSFMRYKDLLD